ncbi:MAG: hypothetical protein IPJ65_00855 [Archangiaceae bacterium]|nr:hypothetical protein [Archangiaceae bacterium]
MAEVILKNRFASEEEPLAPEILKAGAVSGLAGGVLMAVWAMFATLALGLGPFAVPQLIGATFRGPEALLQGPTTIVIGVVLHLLVSAFFGTLFSMLVRRDTPRGIAALAGVAFSLGVFVLMTFVVMPVVNPVMSSRVAMMIGTVLVMHVLYGVALGTTPILRRKFARRTEQLVPTKVTISAV